MRTRLSRVILPGLLLGAAVAAAWLLLVAIPRQAVVVERLPLTTSPTDMGLAFEAFTTSPADSDLQLAGWWMPAKNARATLVFIHGGAPVEGLVLLDPLLHTADVFARGAWVQTGLPAALFAPSAWAASTFHGLPGGPEQALERAARLDLPMLLLQDPDDPVTRARHSEELARRNRRAVLWMAPPVAPDHPDLAWKKRWGSHVAAFELFPRETTAQIIRFMDSVAGATDMAREDNRHGL